MTGVKRVFGGSLEDLPADKEYGYPAKPLQKEKEEGGKPHPFDICLQLVVHAASPDIPGITKREYGTLG